jgi:hypothetical protein
MSSASEKADSDKDSMVSDHFHIRSGKIVQLPREWWKIDLSNDIQMEGFKRLSEVDSSVPEPKSDDKITHFSRLEEAGFVIEIVEEEGPKEYWNTANGPNGQLWKEAVDKKLDSLDRTGTWDIVDKVEGRKEISSKWVFKVKRLADGSIDKFKARLVAQGFT